MHETTAIAGSGEELDVRSFILQAVRIEPMTTIGHTRGHIVTTLLLRPGF